MPQVVSEEYDGVIYKGTRQEVDSIIQGIKNRGYARFPDIDELVFLPDYHEARKQDKDEGKSDDRINQEQTQKRLDVIDGPGFYRGFVSGLTNDDALGVQYLFERRFPELASTGGVAEDYYFYRKDDEGNTVLSYLDPLTQTVKDEFADVDLGLGDVRADNFFGWVGPAFTFATESIGSVAGMTKGAILGSPAGVGGQVGLASVLGGIGGAGGRAFGDGVRAGASLLLDGPPLDRDKFVEDATMAGVIGLFPIGAGFTSPIKNVLKTVNAKFTGEDGKTALKTLLTEGGEDVDKIVQLAKDKYDIRLTRAEAQGIKTNAGQIQRYLSQQPTSERLFEFYEDRASRMEDALDNFFDELARGKYFDKIGVGGRRRGEFEKLDELGEGSAYEDLLDAYDSALKKMLEQRKINSNKLYKEAFDAAEEGEITFDLSDLKSRIQASIDDPQIGKLRSQVFRQINDILSIPKSAKVDFTGTGYKDNLRSLDEAVKDLGVLYESYAPGGRSGNRRLASIVADVKGELVETLKSGSKQYAKARETWSQDIGHLQLFERGFLKQIASAVRAVDSKAGAKAIENMFTGKASAGEINRLKELLIAEDPRVWQNLKANWLRTKLSDAIKDTVTPFGTPNKFLQNIGIKNPKRAFGRGAEKQRSEKINALRAILEPKELQNFSELTEIAQAISYIAKQSTSATQPLQALERFIAREAAPGGVVTSAIRSAIELPQRLVIRGFDDLAARQASKQKEAYEDVLITALIDGKAASQLAESLRAINPYMQFITNAVARGVEDFSDIGPSDLKPARTDDEGRPIRKDQAPANVELRRRLEELRALEDQKTPEPDIGMFTPLPGTTGGPQSDFIDSPTLLPSDQDRELARRLQGGIGGLGAIA
jgi:hypothetical protein